jgi:hypothetical protein
VSLTAEPSPERRGDRQSVDPAADDEVLSRRGEAMLTSDHV